MKAGPKDTRPLTEKAIRTSSAIIALRDTATAMNAILRMMLDKHKWEDKTNL